MTLTTDAALTLVPIPIPESVEAADAPAFAALARLWNASCRRDTGHDYFDTTAAEIIPDWVERTNVLMVGVIGYRGTEAVGVATAAIPLDAGAGNAELDVFIDPDQWGEGAEETLLAAIEDTVREHGRTTMQIYSLHRPDADGARLAPPTGFGSIPAEDRQTRFLMERGYTLKQVERNSVLPLDGDDSAVRALRDEAAAVAGHEYRLVSWTGPTPDEHKDGYAYALSRLSTDAPTGDLEWAEETWDAARVERRDARIAAAGLTSGVTIAIHVPTGAVCAYTNLAIGEDPAGATRQWGTLVLREHRGRRLGALVKCENLLRWREIAPLSPRVSTFNAEENRYMLDVNEAMGFVPASYAGAWQKRIDDR